MLAMTRAMVSEFGEHGINVNAIAGGYTLSDNVRRGKHVEFADKLNIDPRAKKRSEVPADLVGAPLFLASSESDFVTGQTLIVDGGSIMRCAVDSDLTAAVPGELEPGKPATVLPTGTNACGVPRNRMPAALVP